ncbi:MAG: L-threonylcarbamoyladenylate synthase [Halobacteriales archaeon]
MMKNTDAAVQAIEAGDVVVYPTETVYGLGADALNPTAIERAFELKGRPRDDPLSMGVPSIERALSYTKAGDVARACMEAFLPGPVTVICESGPEVPDVLTAGRDRVGIRIPAHELALDLLDRTAPITATSANLSGTESVVHPDGLDQSIRDAVAVILDAGETPGTESTVVDPERGEIHRRGAMADAVAAWLETQ